jgi:hypothetical protein
MLVVRFAVIADDLEPSDDLSDSKETQHFSRDESHGG